MGIAAPLHAVVNVDETGPVVDSSTDAAPLLGIADGTAAAGIDARTFVELFDSTPVCAALFDTDGRYIRVNDNLCTLLGRAREQLLGRCEEEFTHPDDQASDLEGARTILAGELDQWQTEKRFARPDGSIVWTIASMTFLRDGGGAPLCWVGQFQDITDRRAIEAQLRDRERQLADAADEARRAQEYAEAIIAAMGEGYGLTVDGRITSVNDALCELTGFTREQLTGAAAPFPFWPHDMLTESQATCDRIVSAGGGTFEMTLMRADGSLFDAEITAKRAYNPDGSELGFVNTVRDISERRRVEEEQRALREIAELVADGASEAVVFAAAAKHVRDLFRGFGGAVVQFDRAAAVARLRSVAMRSEEIAATPAYPLDGDGILGEVCRSGRPVRRDSIEAPSVFDPHGDVVGAVAAPVIVKGQTWGALVVSFARAPAPVEAEARLSRFANLVAMAVSNSEAWNALARQAATDSVTGLANHRTFHEQLRIEIEWARRHERPLSLVLLDLDHFKRVNDTFGHQAGDQVLGAFARILDRQAHRGELVARIGGEEFAWLIPEADAAAAYQAAERIRQLIEREQFPYAGRITVSAGVATTDGEMVAGELVRLADSALYRAKDSGRNATFLDTDEAHAPLSDPTRYQAFANVRALPSAGGVSITTRHGRCPSR